LSIGLSYLVVSDGIWCMFHVIHPSYMVFLLLVVIPGINSWLPIIYSYYTVVLLHGYPYYLS